MLTEEKNHYFMAAGCTCTNTVQYVAGLCHCEPTLNNSSTWVQGSSLENCLLASLYCCTWQLHPWGRISHFSSVGHTRLLLCQATSPGPTEWWLLHWTTWYRPNKLIKITLETTIHTIKRYQIALVPKLILEGTSDTCNLLPVGLCFIDPHPLGSATQSMPHPPCRSLTWSIPHQPGQKAPRAHHVQGFTVLQTVVLQEVTSSTTLHF